MALQRFVLMHASIVSPTDSLGMATRLAFHLALHLDMTTHVSSGSITQQEADLRRDIFWAAYTVDQ